MLSHSNTQTHAHCVGTSPPLTFGICWYGCFSNLNNRLSISPLNIWISPGLSRVSQVDLFLLFLKDRVGASGVSGVTLSMPYFQTRAESVSVWAHVLVISPLSSVYTGLTGAEVRAARCRHHRCQQRPPNSWKKEKVCCFLIGCCPCRGDTLNSVSCSPRTPKKVTLRTTLSSLCEQEHP